MERLAFVLEMIDKVSRPARQAVAMLRSVMQTARSAMSAVGSGLSAVAGTAKSVAGFAGAIGAAATGLGGAGISMLFDSLTFQQSTKSAFSAIEGSTEKGAQLYDHILGMAKHFRQRPKEMMESVMQLKSAGMETTQALSLLQTGLDLTTLKPSSNIQALITQLGQAKSKGKLMTQEMMVLAESGGLASGKIKEALVGVLGLGKVDPTNLEKVEKLLSSGKINADQGIAAVQKAVMSLTGTTKAGEYAEKARNSIGALWNGLKAAPEQFLLRMSVDDGPLKKLLLMLNNLFDPTTESGQRMMESLNRIGAQIMQIFGKMGTPENMLRLEKFIINLIKLLPMLISIASVFLDVFVLVFDAIVNVGDNAAYVWKELGNLRYAFYALILVLSPILILIAAIAAPLFAIGYVVYWVGSKIYEFISWLSKISLGDVINGLFGGLLSALTTVAEAVGNTIKKISDGIASVKNIASSVTGKIGGAFKSAVGGVKNFFGIGKPEPAPEPTPIAPAGSATPVARSEFAAQKTANINVGNINVQSVNGDTPTNKTVANDIGNSVRRELTLAMRQAGSELG